MSLSKLHTAACLVVCTVSLPAHLPCQITPGIRLLDGWRYTSIYCAQSTTDGGIVLAGGTGSYWDHTDDDGLLVKLDANGNFVWNKIFGGSGEDRLLWVTRAHGGGYIAAGTTRSAGYPNGTWLVRIAESGKIRWCRSYDTGAMPTRIVKIDTGGYAISAGSTILRITSAGSVRWLREYSPINASVIPTAGGGFLLSGQSWYGTTCARIAANGNLLWCKRLDGIRGRDACETEGGDFILVTERGCVRLDATGKLRWAMEYSSAQRDEPNIVFTGIQPAGNDRYMVAGFVGYDDDAHDSTANRAFCMQIDGKGRITWQRKMISGSRESELRSIQPLPGGDYLLAGYARTFGSEPGEDALAIRITSSGDTGPCSALFQSSSFVESALNQPIADGDPTVTIESPPARTNAAALMATWEAISWSPCIATEPPGP